METNGLMRVKTDNNLFIQSIINAANEILGSREAKRVLNAAGTYCIDNNEVKNTNTPAFLSDLGNEFAISFQRNTARELMMRIGGSSFEFLWQNTHAFRDLIHSEDLLTLTEKQINYPLEILADELSIFTGLNIKSSFQNDRFSFLEIGVNGSGPFSSELYLYLFAGVLRAFGSCINSRKEYHIIIKDDQEGEMEQKRICIEFLD